MNDTDYLSKKLNVLGYQLEQIFSTYYWTAK